MCECLTHSIKPSSDNSGIILDDIPSVRICVSLMITELANDFIKHISSSSDKQSSSEDLFIIEFEVSKTG